MNGNDDCLQPVKYLGKVRSMYAHGMGVAIEPVRIVWTRSKKGSRYNRCAVSIHPFGLSIYEEIANGTYKNVWSDAIEDISYCVAEPLHRRIFAWIARSPHTNELECHVILCKTSKRARILAELLAKSFHDSYRYRQQQQQQLHHQRGSETTSLSARCSVCDTLAREQQNNRMRPPLFRSHSHDHGYNDDIEHNRQQMQNNYERMSFNAQPIARAFVRSYESNSMNSSSRRSIDNDTTLADEESIKPVEYYRG
ncbi:unnamed protein product [Rotaria magnacalcarata]|uniref:PID domain-containing protein n=2 Tax=Rotaria magnacalcarata TaxID=392030 RepID=A0A815RB15_9BILA|nr:unnamed protein product [Rotaria magnacalcarata]CAF1554833.1 unnamed protein product [Rotaria magnacalcarata]CAF2142500.1 unnamed protein product [Rotaria magnacalcarata]CAF4107481.1 unnamed protein product [Rotaria magnacalcarata]